MWFSFLTVMVLNQLIFVVFPSLNNEFSSNGGDFTFMIFLIVLFIQTLIPATIYMIVGVLVYFILNNYFKKFYQEPRS